MPRDRIWPSLDDAEQPQDEDQDQQTAKTDIHRIPPFRVAGETVTTGPPFPSLRRRDERLGYYFTFSESAGIA
jgi:hypothetical protein